MRKNILILGHNDATQFIDIYNQYTKLFDPASYDVTVAFLTGEETDAVKKRLLAPRVIFFDMPKKSLRGLKIKAILTLLKLCKEKNFQYVICHRYKPTYIMLWVACFIRLPALLFVMHELRTMAARSRKMIMQLLFRKNMLLAGVSDAVRDDMRTSLPSFKERIITLYNMIDIDLTEPALLSREEARAALKLPSNAFVFGNIARLAINKDHENLIHAFAQVKKNAPKAKLIIIGDGELEASLKAKVTAQSLQHDVIFTGFLPNGFRYMKAFDCFVLPSIQEAFGRVLLEAMVASVPIIASKVHGIPEVLGNTGTLIKPKEPMQLADAMIKTYLLSQEEREILGKKGYERAHLVFSIPAFQQQFWSLPLTENSAGSRL